MDMILGIPLGESYSGIHALADLSVCIKIYQQLSSTVVGEIVAELTASLA
jgi:hypothetical protein